MKNLILLLAALTNSQIVYLHGLLFFVADIKKIVVKLLIQKIPLRREKGSP